MRAFEHGSVHVAGLSPKEKQILEGKARGLSDLEVALKLCLYERDVRAITQKFKKHRVNGNGGSTIPTLITPKK